MAGNIVKWWKHKILGGYKQFSVQECTTDSEELMQNHLQMRASSSCSAPPDLLLVSEHENSLSYRSAGTHHLTSTSNPNDNLNGGGGGGEYAEILHQLNSTKDVTTKYKDQSNSTSTKQKSKKLLSKLNEIGGGDEEKQLPRYINNEKQQFAVNGGGGSGGNRDDKLRFEEFTCDVSVEGGKTSKPLQFSFTFYDLDGHHGKITKDDIVGIVYTIYESIGKSVVVPHCGSKTINVRLTFSPESKSKSNNAGTAAENSANMPEQRVHAHAHTRRQHRYRPRKLIKSDDEDDESNSDKEKENNESVFNGRKLKCNIGKSKSHHRRCQEHLEQLAEHPSNPNTEVPTTSATQTQSITESYYDSLPIENLKCCTKDAATAGSVLDKCSGCEVDAKQRQLQLHHHQPQATTRTKVLRKTRKQKFLEHYPETRQRSLSVGNEVCWKNRHLLQQHLAQTMEKTEEHTIDGVQLRHPYREPNLQNRGAQKRNSAECWKTALNRNDLISIIRESMEKNRLCFQLNEKPQANVSPIRQTQKRSSQPLPATATRLRANGASKIPTLIANHNNISITNNSFISKNSAEPINTHDNNSTAGSMYHHLQPHIPIYHQQMAINPAVLAAQNGIIGHSKMNPCGYDSFLHATICGGRNVGVGGGGGGANNNNSYSPPPVPPAPLHTTQISPTLAGNQQFAAALPTQQQHQQQQQPQPIAAVQPMISVPTLQNDTKIINPTSHQIKMSKILRSGSYTQSYQNYHSNPAGQNSPQYRGYQRLQSSSSTQQHAMKYNLAALNTTSHSSNDKHADASLHETRERISKSKPSKAYESLLYAKLREDLQESGLNGTTITTTNAGNGNDKEISTKLAAQKCRRHKFEQRPYHCRKTLATASEKTDYMNMIHMNGADSIECENLLGQTTDEETVSEMNTPNEETAKLSILESEETLPTPTTDTLIDLNDDDIEEDEEEEEDVETETPEDIADIVDKNLVEEELVDVDDDEEDDVDDVEVDDDDDLTAVANNSHMSPSNSKAALITTNNNNNNASTNNTSASSSLIHRCVHEHIHHHYHHFEKKDE